MSIGKRVLSWIPEVVGIASGILLSLAYPPGGEGALAWIALVPLMMGLRGVGAKRGFRVGFFAGWAFWLSSIAWFWVLTDNGGPWFFVVLGHVALSAYCALYVGGFGALLARGGRGGESAWRDAGNALKAAVVWSGLEWVRSTFLTGFAWNPVGVSQVRSLPLLQVASVGGVYAVSFLVVWVNATVANVVLRLVQGRQKTKGGRPRHSVDLMLALLALLGVFLWGISEEKRWSALEEESAAFRVAGVQPNAPSIFERGEKSIHETFLRLSQRTAVVAKLQPDVVVWPETVLLGGLPGNEESIHYAMQHARGSKAPLLAGGVEFREDEVGRGEGRPLVANVSCLFEPGKEIGYYRKQHLVPFGEFIPGDRLFPILERLSPTGISCTPGEKPVLFSIPMRRETNCVVQVSPLICFEDTVAPLARKAVRAGAQVLINQTNDAWFEGSREPAQHHAQAVFRAIETRTPLVRVSNGGVSGTISASGLQSAPATYFCQEVRPRQTGWPMPLYARFGDWVLGIPCAGWALLEMLFRARRRGYSRRRRREGREG